MDCSQVRQAEPQPPNGSPSRRRHPGSDRNNLEQNLKLLQNEDSLDDQIIGSCRLLELAKTEPRLDTLSQLEQQALFATLTTVLRRESLAGGATLVLQNVIHILFCFSVFRRCHPILDSHRIPTEALSAAVRMLRVPDLEQTLVVAVHLLLNLCDDTKVQARLVRKKVVHFLRKLLDRKSVRLQTVALRLLHKLSCYGANVTEMKRLGLVESFAAMLQHATHPALQTWTLHLLFNLSFDQDARNRVVQGGLLPRLVRLLPDPASRKLVCCILYHLSMDDKMKGVFAFTDCVAFLLKLILDCSHDQVELEVMALAVNLMLSAKNAQLVCEGHGLRLLMRRALHYQDPLIMKMMRNISQHPHLPGSAQWAAYAPDVAQAILQSNSDDFIVECLGVLANLDAVLDYAFLRDTGVLNWMKCRVSAALGDVQDDDLLLEMVLILATCATRPASAMALYSDDKCMAILTSLLRAKQEDDEMVLQVMYVFHLLAQHPSLAAQLAHDQAIVAYLIDLVNDTNQQIQRLVTATVDILSWQDPHLRHRVAREKFVQHNSQWLAVIGCPESTVMKDCGESQPDAQGACAGTP